MSLDIKKAFHSIGHQYLSKVLDFFNFGPNIKNGCYFSAQIEQPV